ncbi:site-specific DNA-methyltransferase [Faecalibacterium prausnitzii]|uniref:site-specific DNA-methyltransferase n=1 Tax=Faecalibacterium prausnitzii TaxID=853 RepID=UPI003F1E0999
MSEVEQLTFEFAQRPTIKGFPELRWTGKRPYKSTQYYPAQLRETYGEEQNGWMNKIFWGDNLQVMSHLLKEYRGQIDLVYIDPPFDSKADYKKKIDVKGVGKAESDSSTFEEKQYGDIWTNDEYLQFMYERLMLLKELLSEKGSIFLHCDWRKSHFLRCILDEIFGSDCFCACISWRAMTSSGYKGKSSLGRSHADILYYTKKKGGGIYNPYFLPLSENMLKRYTHEDPDGRKFKDSNLGNVTAETVERLRKEGKLYVTANGTPRIKHYLDEADGIYADDVWTDINTTNSQANIQTGYPTQKPEELLKRIISIASNPDDIVFDCFMGSGTTQAVAMKLGRRFIGADINLGAIQTTTKRLVGVANELNSQMQEETKYTGFEVYNVNNYDFFRNPVEARDLLIQALEIQPFPQSNVWDGELDGRMVKIMPVNRIATKADLKELLANLPYTTYEKRKEENPNQPVEHMTIVCMGHEPDLKGSLEQELSNYKVDVQILDVLRDKADLQLKRDSEAEIVREGNKLVIREFFPMNLMQKLSLQKEYVEEWRQLVDSVMIDWNYDGAVMQPRTIDIPEKNELVKGVYDIPEDAGTIKVKITDLLSESLEVEVR